MSRERVDRVGSSPCKPSVDLERVSFLKTHLINKQQYSALVDGFVRPTRNASISRTIEESKLEKIL